MYRWLFVIALVVPSIFIFCNYHIAKDERVFIWDIAGYHLYNPSLFLYKDTKKYAFYDSINVQYHIMNGSKGRYGLVHDTLSQNDYNIYPCGVAIIQMPAYFISDFLTKVQSKYPRNGYSYLYQQGVAINTLLCTIIACYLLFLLLSYHSDSKVALITVSSIYYGTNLFNYTFINPGMSHNYSFFLLSALLYLLFRYHKSPRPSLSLFAGIIFGLLLMVRNTNIFFILVLFINWYQLKWIRNIELSHLFIFAISAFVSFLPQIWWWYQATGKFLINSYGIFLFYFDRPQIIASLFSYRKGWFVYTPLAFIYVISLFALLKNRRYMGISFAILFILLSLFYFNCSWNNWYYGGSFGYRPMIETYAILCFPFALWIRHFHKGIVIIILVLISVWNIIQTLQYKKSVLSSDSMNQNIYWAIIGKMKNGPEIYQHYYPMTHDDPGGYPFVTKK